MDNKGNDVKLCAKMVENLDKSLNEDGLLSDQDQYLLEKVNNFADLFHFLDHKGIFDLWSTEDVLLYLLESITNGTIDLHDQSPEYQRAKGNAERYEVSRDPLSWRSEVDHY